MPADFVHVRGLRRTVAGRRAQEIYREGLVAWHRAIWLPALALTIPFIGGGAALGMYTSGMWRFAGGMAFGAGFTILFWVRDTPPNYVENGGSRRQRERKTERALRSLAADGWVVRHDLPGRGRANTDHVVIGPPGIFLLDSKVRSGKLAVQGDRVVCRRLGSERFSYDDPVGGSVARAAKDLRLDLGGSRDGIPPVRGVAVIWGRLDEDAIRDQFVILRGARASAWLNSEPAELSRSAIAELARKLDALGEQRRGKASA